MPKVICAKCQRHVERLERNFVEEFSRPIITAICHGAREDVRPTIDQMTAWRRVEKLRDEFRSITGREPFFDNAQIVVFSHQENVTPMPANKEG